jgi:hypothetical protein
MSGIGVIIIIQQLYPLIGCKSPVLVIDMIKQFPERVANGVSFTALALGLGTIAIIYLFPLITKKIPSTLVALLVMTVISLFLNMDEKLLIGQIPSGFPMPVFAKEGLDLACLDWGAVLKASIIPGLTLAGLGSIDTLLTSVVADNITKTHHNSNRELVGQGIGAGQKLLTRSFAHMSVGLGIMVMTLMGVLMWAFAPQLMAIMSPVSEVIALGAQVLRIEAWAEPMFAAAIVINGIFVGAGDTIIPAIMSLGSMWAVRLSLAATLAPKWGLKGVWTAMAIELTFRGVIFLVRLFKGGWADKLKLKQV